MPMTWSHSSTATDRAIPADLPALVSALATADVAFGRRPGRLIEDGAMPWHARLGNDLVAAIMSIRTGRRVHDMPPFKALRAPILTRLELSDAGYGWTTQLVARVIAEPTIRFREMPVRFRRRQGGTSKVSGSWRASVAAGRAMVGRAWSETTARPLLGLMAKAPGAGRAKTRLAAELGDEATTAFWTACLSDAADGALGASRAARLAPIAMLPSIADVDAVVRIVGPAWTPIVQTRPGLAAALVDVFLAAFDRGADRALAVAGDAPGLPPSRIEAAMAVLARGPRGAVLGPADDGGYHLVGARWRQVPRATPAPIRRRLRRNLADRLRRAFAESATGDSTAFDAARRGLESAGWQVATVESWPDVDTVSDLRAPGGAAGRGRALGTTDGRVAEAQPSRHRRRLTVGPCGILPLRRGAIAQLGERLNGIQKVRGSNPRSSTNTPLTPTT